MVIPEDFQKEHLFLTPEEFESYYNGLSGDAGLKTEGKKKSKISYEDLTAVLKKHLGKFPMINSVDPISDKDLKRIFKDFPDFETVAEVDSNRQVIFDYYQLLARPEIAVEVASIENQNTDNAKLTGISPGTLSTPERNHLLGNPAYALHYAQAANDASGSANQLYPNHSQISKGNAFRHAVWNALSILYILNGSPASENQAIDFTQDGTSAHEKDDSGNQVHNIDVLMDLHNNMSAREWMKIETKWGVGPLRKMPSFGNIIDTFYAKANSCAMHPMIDILNWHGGANSNTWNDLYNNMYSPNNHLVHAGL